jgi:hypothetical protein
VANNFDNIDANGSINNDRIESLLNPDALDVNFNKKINNFKNSENINSVNSEFTEKSSNFEQESDFLYDSALYDDIEAYTYDDDFENDAYLPDFDEDFDIVNKIPTDTDNMLEEDIIDFVDSSVGKDNKYTLLDSDFWVSRTTEMGEDFDSESFDSLNQNDGNFDSYFYDLESQDQFLNPSEDGHEFGESPYNTYDLNDIFNNIPYGDKETNNM